MKPPEELDWVLPFQGMSIGDSFFIPTLRPARMMYILDTRAKAAGIRVKTYVTTKNGLLGVRAWRVR